MTPAEWTERSVRHLEARTALLAADLLRLGKARGWDLCVTCGRRPMDEQAELWLRGRDASGKVIDPTAIVTWARPGESPHQYGLAFDVAPVVNGKAAWPESFPWADLGALGKSIGLEWGGDFKGKKRDRPHFQMPQWKRLVKP